MHIYIHTHIYIHIFIYSHTYIYRHTHTHIYIFTHTHIYTYTGTPTHIDKLKTCALFQHPRAKELVVSQRAAILFVMFSSVKPRLTYFVHPKAIDTGYYIARFFCYSVGKN